MNNRYLESLAVGILTAVVAGFFGIGAPRAGSVSVPPGNSAPLAASHSRGGDWDGWVKRATVMPQTAVP